MSTVVNTDRKQGIEERKRNLSKTKNKIYNSTLELTSLLGYHNISISKIANHAKISPASIYNHFSGKENLMETLYLTIKHSLANAIIQDVDFTIDARTIMRQVWMNTASFYLNNQNKMNFLKYYENTPLANQQGLSEFYTIISPFTEYIHKITKEGLVRNFDAPIFTALTFDVIKSLVTRHHKNELNLTETILEMTFEAVWSGLKTPLS